MLGTPFRHQGRQPGVGLDCAGLIVCTCLELGIPVVDAEGYGRQPVRRTLEKHLGANFERVKDMQPGDFLLMAFAEEPQHIAVYAGDTIIHAYERIGKVVEHRFASVWRSRVRGIYRVG